MQAYLTIPFTPPTHLEAAWISWTQFSLQMWGGPNCELVDGLCNVINQIPAWTFIFLPIPNLKRCHMIKLKYIAIFPYAYIHRNSTTHNQFPERRLKLCVDFHHSVEQPLLTIKVSIPFSTRIPCNLGGGLCLRRKLHGVCAWKHGVIAIGGSPRIPLC